MSLHEDLLDQASQLSAIDPLRPRQANLRRAVSSAYYALFHFVIARASAELVGAAFHRRELRHLISRLFDHAEMKSACASFGGGTLPVAVTRTLGPLPVPEPVRDLAKTFVMAQDFRHQADYDLAGTFSRTEVAQFVKRIRQDMNSFDQMPASDAKSLFLIALMTWDKVKRRA